MSGTWTLPWSCPDTSGSEIAVAYLDANTHAIPMVLPYSFPLSGGAFHIDTTLVPNGVHKVVTRCDTRVSSGTTSAVTQLLINVANP